MNQHIILIFNISELPKLDSSEQEWADSILECLRGNNPRALPNGVSYLPDFKKDETLSAMGGASPIKVAPLKPPMQNPQPRC